MGLVEKWDTTKIPKCALTTSHQRMFKDERYCNTKKAKPCYSVKLVSKFGNLILLVVIVVIGGRLCGLEHLPSLES